MKLTKISPRGFCFGVVNSWKIIIETIKQYKDKSQIYMLGWFVHNKQFVQSITNQGVILLDDTKTSRYETIKQTNFNKQDVIIFSAHGTPQEVFDLAKSKDLIIVDTTCKFVYDTYNKIKQILKDDNNQIIYIGKKNHPESIACTSLSKKIIFVQNKEDVQVIDFDNNKQYHVLNQTTLSIFDLYNIHETLKSKTKNITFYNDICEATTERAQAIININKEVDILLIVGDLRSNNTNSLKKISIEKNKIDSYIINSIDDINKEWFINKKHIAITSGASTPTWLTNNIIEYIIKEFNIKEIND